jgi:hypothetical protein
MSFQRKCSLLVLVALTAHTVLVGQAAGATEATRRPVLVELFTSEGCSSCPPADLLLSRLDQTQPIEGVQILVLSEHVDYWDSLGWRDPNSSPSFTLRQGKYAVKLGVESPYTPELVVDGHQELVGSRAEDAKIAITKAGRNEKIPMHITKLDNVENRARVAVSVDPDSRVGSGAKVYIAVAANETHSSVGRGENAGRQLSHVAVVRTLEDLGVCKGSSGFRKEVTLSARPEELPNLRVIAFIQDARSLQVLGSVALAHYASRFVPCWESGTRLGKQISRRTAS